MSRALETVIVDQERVFSELLEAQRQLAALNRAGRQFGIVDGESSDIDVALGLVHATQHRLEELLAEGLQAALTSND